DRWNLLTERRERIPLGGGDLAILHWRHLLAGRFRSVFQIIPSRETTCCTSRVNPRHLTRRRSWQAAVAIPPAEPAAASRICTASRHLHRHYRMRRKRRAARRRPPSGGPQFNVRTLGGRNSVM